MRFSALVLSLFAVLHRYSVVQASVFQNRWRWPINDDGYAIIPICLLRASKTTQLDHSVDNYFWFHDENPSLTTVVGKVRYVLSRTWEANSGVRFVGWEFCDTISLEQQEKSVGIYIHPAAPNNSYIGTSSQGKFLGETDDATSWKPWGNFDQCIFFNVFRLRAEYRYSCAEEYAIHEVGHAIGLDHEWLHPQVPSGCSERDPVSASQYSTTFDEDKNFTIVNPTSYDYDSIMNYVDGCAETEGTERFGSRRLTDFDKQGIEAVYPKPKLGANDVGVLLNTKSDCPGHKLVEINIDNQDFMNFNSKSGWTGATEQDSDTTLFRFCRVDGANFGTLPDPGGSNNGHYAVLQLGTSCPSGAIKFRRYHDDSSYPPVNKNWMAGELGPLRQNWLAGIKNSHVIMGTELHFCFFEHSSNAGIKDLPNLGFQYGVIANSQFTKAAETGIIYMDDNNFHNENRIEDISFDKRSVLSEIIDFSGDGWWGHTEYRVARVNTAARRELEEDVELVEDIVDEILAEEVVQEEVLLEDDKYTAPDSNLRSAPESS